jgi:hypothetical protein
MNSATEMNKYKEDNEVLILELGIKQKHVKRRQEKAWLVQQNKYKRATFCKKHIRERNLEKELVSKARLNCRNKYKEFNDSECRVGDAPWPRVTWKALGMEPFLKVPGHGATTWFGHQEK